METISNILHGVKDAVMGHPEPEKQEQKPVEEAKPVVEDEHKGVLSKIGEVMKEILLPPTEDLVGEPTLKESEPVISEPVDEKKEVKKSPLSTPVLPAASSSSKKESESLSGKPELIKPEVKAEIGTAEFKPARTAILTSSMERDIKPADLKAVATFTPAQPDIRAELVPLSKGGDASDAKERVAELVQPAVRSYLSRKSWTAGQTASSSTTETATDTKSISSSEASARIQRSARRWLLRHRAEQRSKTGAQMSQDDAARVIQERCRRWLDSTGFVEHKKARKHKKRHHKKAAEKQEESKLEHFGRLVREARGETPAAESLDKAHLSAPAKAHLVEMIQQTTEALKNRDESHLPKLKEADLFKPVVEPVPTRPEPTHTQQESGQPGHFIQQPRA